MRTSVVRYDSPEAATYKTGIEGWVSRDGHFYGKDEHMARWAGCTHLICKDCGQEHPRNSWCQPCHNRKRQEKFLAFPEIPYAEAEYPLCVFDDDRFFWDEVELLDYMADLDDPDTLQIVTTKPGHLHLIDADIWSDDLPEDGKLPDEVARKVDELNAAIRAAGPVAWWAADNRVDITPLVEVIEKERRPTAVQEGEQE